MQKNIFKLTKLVNFLLSKSKEKLFKCFSDLLVKETIITGEN